MRLRLLIIASILFEWFWSQPPEDGKMMAFAPLAFAFAAFSAVTGIYSSYVQRQASRQQAALAQQQADMNRQAARLEAEDDAREENQKMSQMRDQQRRRRAAIESAYAKSGVLLEGTPAQLLENQRGADEYNTQQLHWSGNERRKRKAWHADGQHAFGMAKAKAYKRAGNNQFIAGIGQSVASSVNTYKLWS